MGDKDDLARLLDEAFPIDEILPLAYYLEYRSTPGVMVYSFRNDEGKFIGFMQTVEGNGIVYLSYLAFFKAYQCLGYGSKAIDYLKGLYPNTPIAVDRESTIDHHDADTKRRIAFYRKNGFVDVPCFQLQLGVIYQTMSYNGFSFESLKKLIEDISHVGDKDYWAYYVRTYEEAVALRRSLEQEK